MPAVASGKVLITGANGFIAVWTVKAFLEAGFSVRGTVRSAAKAEHLKTTFSSYADKLEFVVVPDILEKGAFDQAVLGVDAVVHTASPVHLAADEPSEVIDPAVNGTLGILRSAALPLALASVRRVVYVSSCAAVLTRDAPARVYDETCWNDADARVVETLGRDADPLAKYSASKIYAERAAWAFYEEQKETLPWDLVVVNPPWVFGPVLHEVRGGPESLNPSNSLYFDAVTKGEFTVPDNCYVDVRDLALALTLAVEKPEASGQRIIVSQGKFKWQDFAVAANKISDKIPSLKEPYDASTAEYKIVYNNTKSKEALGITYRTLEETTADILKGWETRGWL
ncbi:NAD-P-binding protein [Trametes gibbosa]|nr:NAD-P-binding protein [Trametes gibbosa]